MMGISRIPLINENLYVGTNGGEYGADYDTRSVYGTFRHILEQYDNIPAANIDYYNLAAERSDWLVSRNITVRKSSFDYLRELCNHSFVSIVPTRAGLRRLTAWLEDASTPFAFSESNIIRGSLRGVKYTPLSKVFTSYNVQYAWDDGLKKFAKSYTIAKVDEDTFPDVGSDWTPYASGFEANEYADAKSMWERAHEGWRRIKSLAPLPKNYSEAAWYHDNKLLSGGEYGSKVNAARLYLWELTNWTTLQKQVVQFEVAITPTTVALELLAPVTVNDTIHTNGAVAGYITKLAYNLEKGTIGVEVIIKPYDYMDLTDDLVVERGTPANAHTHTERGDQGDDTITETGVTT